jgi:serine/threonine-protein kinase
MFVVAEKYRVVAPISEGGMGAVYSAIHIPTGRKVAVKLLREEIADDNLRARFLQEARIARGLVSPHIAKVLDSGLDPVTKAPFIAMELLEGEDVRSLLSRRGRLPVGLVLVIAAHVTAGLMEAHEAEIVHRDIKPANVVLSSNVQGELVAKIIDFGIARAQTSDNDVKTRTGDLIGSLPYMSPEQLAGKPLDARTDIWSLGILMYEALSGKRPTGDSEALAPIVERVCFSDLPSLAESTPWLSDRVTALVDRAVRRAREDRFSGAREMHDAIVALLENGIHPPFSAIEAGDEIAIKAGPGPAPSGPAVQTMLSAGAEPAPPSLEPPTVVAATELAIGVRPPDSPRGPAISHTVLDATRPGMLVARAQPAAAPPVLLNIPMPEPPKPPASPSLVMPISGALLFAILAGGLWFSMRGGTVPRIAAPPPPPTMTATAVPSPPTPRLADARPPAVTVISSASSAPPPPPPPPRPSASAVVRVPTAKPPPPPPPPPPRPPKKDPLEHM